MESFDFCVWLYGYLNIKDRILSVDEQEIICKLKGVFDLEENKELTKEYKQPCFTIDNKYISLKIFTMVDVEKSELIMWDFHILSVLGSFFGKESPYLTFEEALSYSKLEYLRLLDYLQESIEELNDCVSVSQVIDKDDFFWQLKIKSPLGVLFSRTSPYFAAEECWEYGKLECNNIQNNILQFIKEERSNIELNFERCLMAQYLLWKQ